MLMALVPIPRKACQEDSRRGSHLIYFRDILPSAIYITQRWCGDFAFVELDAIELLSRTAFRSEELVVEL